MNWDIIVQLLTLLVGGGGIVTLFLVSEKKTAAMLENMNKANEQWQLIVRQKESDNSRLNENLEATTTKVDNLYLENYELHNKLDKKNTELAICKLMRCDCVACPNRKPPYGKVFEETGKLGDPDLDYNSDETINEE